MPEGPEVHAISDVLHARLAGLRLDSFEVTEKSRYFRTKLANIEILSGKVLSQVCCRGKKLIFCFEDDVFMISSLGMEGAWQFAEGKHSGIKLRMEGMSVFYDDSRHFGTLVIVDSVDKMWDQLSDVGPDLISDDVSFEDYHQLLQRKNLQKMKICVFVMEQKYFSGIGNYLRAEILYGCKISPHRPIASLSVDDLRLLWRFSIEVCRASYEAQGATFSTYHTPTGDKGDFKMKVYKQKVDPLGNEVITEVDPKKRTIHWVPAVQK
jgi:DNA-formamidopyrimidine glycosylase